MTPNDAVEWLKVATFAFALSAAAACVVLWLSALWYMRPWKDRR